MNKLNNRQKIFAEEYLKDMNAARAYKRAYPNVNADTAKANGSRMLTNANVKHYINESLNQIHNDNIAAIQEVFEFLTRVMRGELTQEELMNVGTGTGITEIQKFEKSVSIHDRLKAAELLGKAYSMFKDNVNARIEAPTFIGESEIQE